MRPRASAPSAVLIDRKEAASILAVGRNTIDQWDARGILRRVKLPGKLVRYRRADVLRLANQ